MIEGYPVRLALDVVALVFSANPEDYTARGKIITPLKDRIGSEIRTHYPETLEEGRGDNGAGGVSGAGRRSNRDRARVPALKWRSRLRSAAREDKKVDKRSGVSQRLPISTLELVVSNAARKRSGTETRRCCRG